ncbi:helix-turn-helix domain-containing protein [Enterovibrio sp. ZSDZ35]|uniref:Helix-turn-helix domain-containing protein n=1 Tax=Enterovibrio qingdaonensis TaxID=2899818 RepID=A0ABT5QHH8_9GAMM|nr:helix-turn-helix domain-containing protein [Enterovibrio sp. ZSDZ35]MDD1780428.1 helix-turn-helix domain-containing protein [Enterovibrio sp. ZSDZ35]
MLSHLRLSQTEPSLVHLDELQTQITASCGQYSLEPKHTDNPSLQGAIEPFMLSRYEAISVCMNVGQVTRSERMIRQDPGDHLYMLVQDEGRCVIEQNDKQHTLFPGDIFVVDSTQPSRFILNGNASRQVSIHLPREEMLHRYGKAITGGVMVEHDDPLRTALIAVVAKSMEEGMPDSCARLMDSTFDLLGIYIDGREKQKSQSEREKQGVLGRALSLIDRNFNDPTFDAGQLAVKLGVSSRTLQRQFQSLGESPTRKLINTRLDNAKALLMGMSQRDAHRSVTKVAYHCGFSDLSYFYKEFHKRFDMAPGAMVNCRQ